MRLEAKMFTATQHFVVLEVIKVKTLELSFRNTTHATFLLLLDLWCVIRSRVRALLPGGIPPLARGLSLMWR